MGFWLVPIWMTLNDRNAPYIAFSGTHCVELNKDRPVLSSEKSSDSMWQTDRQTDTFVAKLCSLAQLSMTKIDCVWFMPAGDLLVCFCSETWSEGISCKIFRNYTTVRKLNEIFIIVSILLPAMCNNKLSYLLCLTLLSDKIPVCSCITRVWGSGVKWGMGRAFPSNPRGEGSGKGFLKENSIFASFLCILFQFTELWYQIFCCWKFAHATSILVTPYLLHSATLIPWPHTEFVQRSFAHAAPRVWNSLLHTITDNLNISAPVFK